MNKVPLKFMEFTTLDCLGRYLLKSIHKWPMNENQQVLLDFLKDQHPDGMGLRGFRGIREGSKAEEWCMYFSKREWVAITHVAIVLALLDTHLPDIPSEYEYMT